MKKKNKRSKSKYPALEPRLNLKSRYEEISDVASYADQLNDKEKEWLNSFLEEEINANFKHKGPKLNKKVADKRRCYNKNNARNRDLYTKARIQDKMLFIEDVLNDEEEMNEKLKDLFNTHEEGEES